MWVTSWPYRNAIKALLLKFWSCSSPAMWNHSTVWDRNLLGFIFSRSLRFQGFPVFLRQAFCFHCTTSFSFLCFFSAVLSPGLFKTTSSLSVSVLFYWQAQRVYGLVLYTCFHLRFWQLPWLYWVSVPLSCTMWRTDLIIFSSEKQPSEFSFFTLVLCIYNACFKS